MASLKKANNFNYNKVTNELSALDSEEVKSLQNTNIQTVNHRPGPKYGQFTAICSLLVILVLLGLSVVGVAAIAVASYSKVRILQEQNTQLSASLGVVYTQWGGTGCNNNNTDVLYSGMMGGTGLSDTNGGSSHLCLSSDPQYDQHPSSNILEFDFVSVSSYESSSTDSVSCSVCSVPSHTQLLTISGKTSCPEGWALGYSGYLMSGRVHRTEFVCVDHEGVTGSLGVDVLSYVKILCDNLSCPPYHQDRRLNCAVCTK